MPVISVQAAVIQVDCDDIPNGSLSISGMAWLAP